jgi:hypothetical protein
VNGKSELDHREEESWDVNSMADVSLLEQSAFCYGIPGEGNADGVNAKALFYIE